MWLLCQGFLTRPVPQDEGSQRAVLAGLCPPTGPVSGPPPARPHSVPPEDLQPAPFSCGSEPRAQNRNAESRVTRPPNGHREKPRVSERKRDPGVRWFRRTRRLNDGGIAAQPLAFHRQEATRQRLGALTGAPGFRQASAKAVTTHLLSRGTPGRPVRVEEGRFPERLPGGIWGEGRLLRRHDCVGVAETPRVTAGKGRPGRGSCDSPGEAPAPAALSGSLGPAAPTAAARWGPGGLTGTPLQAAVAKHLF